MKQGKKDEANIAKQETASLKVQEKDFKELLTSCADELTEALVKLPNIPHSSVPVGRTPEENVVIFKNDVKGKYILTSVSFRLTTKNHQLTTSYGAIENELAVQKIKIPTSK